MVLKRYRFTAELVLDIADLTDEVVRTSISHYANAQELLADEWTWKHAELEKRLLHALLNHPEVLARFVQKKLAELFEADAVEQVKERYAMAEDAADILVPVINTLPPEDAAHIKRWIANEIFADNTATLDQCFTLRLDRTTLQEERP